MRKLLRQEHQGSSAVESIILAPLCYFTLLFVLYFFFMCVSYIVFNNLATTIAGEMNARVTGYVTDEQTCPDIVVSLTADDSGTAAAGGGGNTGGSVILDKGSIVIKNGGATVTGNSSDIASTNALANTSFYILNKYKDGFVIPFNRVTGITITSNQNMTSGTAGQQYIGTLITVEISFKTSLINMKNDRNLIAPTLTAKGYAIIN